MRFLLSIIILTLLITYAVIPFVKYIQSFFNKEKKRVDKAFNNEKEENEL